MLGPAPVLDFDGTVAALEVDWVGLRRLLGVARIDDLWHSGDPAAWELVTRAEVEAASVARPVGAVLEALSQVEAFAVLTSNTELAVHRFFARWPNVGARLLLIVGREGLGGPKTERDRFRAGFSACVGATAEVRGAADLVYVGDAAYEHAFAAALGATVYHPREVSVRL